jgi:ABC-type xylose transport system permease subunit
MQPVSGVIIHACALATLNRGIVFRISDTLNWAIALWGLLLVLTAIVGVRVLHTRSRLLRQWPFPFIEIPAFAAMSVVVFVVFGWYATARGVAWPHVLWLCGALIVYPFVSERLFRTAVGMPGVLRAAAPILTGRVRGA